MTIPRYSRTTDWPRLVADAVNALDVKVKGLIGARAYSLDTVTFAPIAEPASPVEGMTYFDSGTQKLRTYDGTVWQDHW